MGRRFCGVHHSPVITALTHLDDSLFLSKTGIASGQTWLAGQFLHGLFEDFPAPHVTDFSALECPKIGTPKKKPLLSVQRSHFLGGAKVKKLLCCKLHNSHCEIIDTLPACDLSDGSTMADLSHPKVSVRRQQRPLKNPS